MVATRRRQRCSALGQARTTVSCLLSYESRATRDPCTRDQASYPPERLVDWAAARYAFRCKVGPKGKRKDEKWSRDACISVLACVGLCASKWRGTFNGSIFVTADTVAKTQALHTPPTCLRPGQT